MCQGIIYKATNQINGKIYIGQTIKTFSHRKSQHISTAKKLKEKKECIDIENKDEIQKGTYFHNAINKYGIENFKWEIIYKCDEVMLDMMETFKIMVNHSHWTGNGYNLTWGGKGSSGYKYIRTNKTKQKIGNRHRGKIVSEETRKKISMSCKGRIKSEKHKQKLSESHKGRLFTEEHKQKIGSAHKGRKHTEEQKRKMSESHKGKLFTEEHKQKLVESQKKRYSKTIQ